MNQPSGREKEAAIIRRANRAAAVGRLMLGEMRHWTDFLEADRIDLINLPRRQLKSGKVDVKNRLSEEIKRFCEKNFRGMTPQHLSEMYEDIKAFRGMELTLSEFEQRFALVRHEILRGNPHHLTVSISLWGLQFRIPEEELSRDITEAVELGAHAREELKRFENSSHIELLRNRDAISSLLRQERFAARSVVITCFNLMEAYLNGIAWDYLRTANLDRLSNSSKKLLEDTASASIRKKLHKYPAIVGEDRPWNIEDNDIVQFLEVVKPFRDSLVHPSPFTAPEKFGGYDKLRLLYRIDYETGKLTVITTVKLVVRIHKHIKPMADLPPWLKELHGKFGEGL